MLRITVAALLLASSLVAGEDVRCRSRVVFPPNQLTVRIPFERTRNGVFVQATVNNRPAPLWFVIDSGAARTLISESAAKRLLLHGTESTKLRGVGNGVLSVKVARNVSIMLGAVTIDRIDVRILDLAGLKPAWGRNVDGVLGYDLLCRSTLTIDYDIARLTLTHPAVYDYQGPGETLPLTIRNGWSFVEGTIKVTGRPAVIDNFLIDSGSQDAVNHPIIRDSKGPLKTVKSGVLGPNEWFRLGRFTIGSTDSTCCPVTDETSRQVGAEVLSRFRVTLDYPHRRMILERTR